MIKLYTEMLNQITIMPILSYFKWTSCVSDNLRLNKRLKSKPKSKHNLQSRPYFLNIEENLFNKIIKINI